MQAEVPLKVALVDYYQCCVPEGKDVDPDQLKAAKTKMSELLEGFDTVLCGSSRQSAITDAFMGARKKNGKAHDFLRKTFPEDGAGPNYDSYCLQDFIDAKRGSKEPNWEAKNFKKHEDDDKGIYEGKNALWAGAIRMINPGSKVDTINRQTSESKTHIMILNT
jgi:hypothetical protein